MPRQSSRRDVSLGHLLYYLMANYRDARDARGLEFMMDNGSLGVGFDVSNTYHFVVL